VSFTFDRVPAPNNWAIAIFCALLLVLTIDIVSYRRKISLLSKSLFSQRHFSLLLREGKVVGELFSFVLLIADVAIFAFALLLIVDRFHPEIVRRLTYVGVWGVLIVALQVLYWTKKICNSIYAALFDRERMVYAQQLYKFAFLTNAALILFPISSIAVFANNFAWLYAFIPVFVVLACLWVFKILKINLGRINLFHFFIYFCTLEILPYLVVVKLIAVV